MLGKHDPAKLIVKNGDISGEKRVHSDFQVSSAIIMVNGEQILGPSSFNQNIYQIEVPLLDLGENNNISIELRSKPGSYITILVVQKMEVEGWGVIGPERGDVKVFLSKKAVLLKIIRFGILPFCG